MTESMENQKDSGNEMVTEEEQASVAFQIIAATGTARSYYISAIDKASEGEFEEAEELIDQGKEVFNEGHTAHMTLLQKFAKGQFPSASIIMVHAEDQLMSAEQFEILAEKFIMLYRGLKK
jgi:PTS system cellobiose-specific IIA component